MPKLKIQKLNGYLFAVLISGVIFLLKLVLIHTINWPEQSFVLATFAIIMASWYGGLGPGIVTTLINYLIYDYFFVTPGYLLFKNTPAEDIRIMFFVIEGFLIAWAFESLHHARRKAESLDKKKTEFLSIAAHELKTPISIIKIINETLIKAFRKQKLSRDIFIGIKDTLDEVGRMEILVRDLMDILKSENGTFTLRKEYANINSLVSFVVEKMKNLSGNKNIFFKKRRVGKVYIDKERIEQVLTNLITNALENSPRKSPIEIAIKRENNKLILSVSDRGVGIDENKQNIIFEKYYKIENGQQRGFGLGLFISKQIVEKHAGRIWVESKVGKGSIFYFSLPKT